MLDKYWVKIIVNNNVFLVLLHIVLSDQDNAVETFVQYCYLKVLIWVWCCLYMDRVLFYVTDMPFVLVLRPPVLWCYSLFLQIVSYMVFGRITNHKKRLEIANLLLARDYSNILFHHGT